MIDQELRSKGIGASEVAALLGMDPRRDAFAVWARKLNLIDEPESNIRMRKGKYFEQGIVRWYQDETGHRTEWSDTTMQSPVRSWQVVTPDAFVVEDHSPVRLGGVDAKLVAWDKREGWGDPGTDIVPDHYGIQNQWTCSALDHPWWDIAACLGDELRVYRIHRDPAIETVLLEVVEKFWNVNVLGRTQPPIGATDAAAAYIKKRFPKNVEAMKAASPEEAELMAQFKMLQEEWDNMEARYTPVENQLKLAIGEAEGILHGPWKITFRKDKDTYGYDYEAIVRELDLQRGLLAAAAPEKAKELELKPLAVMVEDFSVVTRKGPRKLRPTWGKK